jgi:hypothetical protein
MFQTEKIPSSIYALVPKAPGLFYARHRRGSFTNKFYCMLNKWDRKAIILDLPKLKEMKETLRVMHRRTNTSQEYRNVVVSLYSQVFGAICQCERKLSETASNDLEQLPLIETVKKDAAGMFPVYNAKLYGNRLNQFVNGSIL